MSLLLIFSSLNVFAQPANDLICNATSIACGNTYAGTTIGATNTGTAEGGSGFCGSWNQNTPGVWYQIVGNGNLITLSLCGTAHDSQIAVYTGTCAAPTCYGANDDNGPACTGLSSSYAFASVTGVTYWVRVWSWSTFTPQFSFNLSVTCTVPPTPPTNDFLCNAIAVTCGSATAGTTIGATNFGTGEVASCAGYAQNTPGVWYKITGNGTVYTASLCGTPHDSQLAVYQGTNPCSTTLTCITSNDDNGPACAGVASSLSWQTAVGVTYYIKVWSWSTFTPTFNFTLNMICTGIINDPCTGATTITTPYSSGPTSTASATSDSPGTVACGAQFNNLWYTIVGNGATLTASTCSLLGVPVATNYDTEIQVYSGSCGALTPVNCNDIVGTSCGSACEGVTWCSVPGVQYYISVGSNSATCSGTFELTVVAAGIAGNVVLENGSYLWKGPAATVSATNLNADSWDIASNWLVYDDVTTLFSVATAPPSLTNNVFIPPASATGCTVNYPRIYSTTNAQCKDITIVTGAKLEFVPASTAYGSLSVSRNWMNSGMLRSVAAVSNTTGGTIKFVGTNNQTISNDPATPTTNGVNNFFNFELNNTGPNTGVILDFPGTNNNLYVINNLNMIAGNIQSTETSRLVVGYSGLVSGFSQYPNTATSLTASPSPVPATINWTQGTSGTVVGPMWRYFRTNISVTNPAHIIFPVGNIAATTVVNRSAFLGIVPGTTSISGGACFKGQFIGSTPPTLTGLPLTDGSVTLQNLATEGYWDFISIGIASTNTPVTTLTQLYSLEVRANQFTSAQPVYLDSRILKAPGAAPTAWTVQGTHGSITGTAADYRITRTGLSGFSYFAIGIPVIPLAVEFTGANLRCDNGNLDLRWSTASEVNSAQFIIETSFDGENWLTAGTVAAAEFSNAQLDYRFAIPYDAMNQSQYIRLSEMDKDGQVSVLGVFSANCEDQNGVLTFPNPSNGGFYLNISDDKFIGETYVHILDAQGVDVSGELKIDVKKGINSYLFDTTGYAPGMYYIQVSNGTYKHIVKHSLR